MLKGIFGYVVVLQRLAWLSFPVNRGTGSSRGTVGSSTRHTMPVEVKIVE